MKENNETPKIQKIDVDSKTGEPVIVKLAEKEAKDLTKDDCTSNSENLETKKENAKSSRGEQLQMDVVFGMKNDDTISKRQKIFKRVFTVLFIVLIVGVLIFTAYNDFFKDAKKLPSWETVSGIIGANWYYIIFAFISLFFCYFLKGLKLSVLCKKTTGKWHFKTSMQTGVVGLYYNYVTPLAVGGQPFEIYYLNKHGINSGVATSLPIVAYFLSSFAFVALGMTSLILFNFNAFALPTELASGVTSWVAIVAIVGLVLALIAPVAVIIFCTVPRFGSKIVYFVMWLGGKFKIVKNPKVTTYKTLKTLIHNSNCIKTISKSPLYFGTSTLLSLGEHLALCSIAYFTLRFFGYDLPNVNGFIEWLQIVQFCLILYVAISFIPTPGNSGAADFSFYFLFQWGLSQNSTITGLAFPAMITWRLISFYSFLIIGFIFLRIKKKQEHKIIAN